MALHTTSLVEYDPRTTSLLSFHDAIPQFLDGRPFVIMEETRMCYRSSGVRVWHNT